MTARTEHAASSEAGLTGSGPGNSSAAAAPFDSPLSAAMLNIEAKSRSNLFPWRGQFSPQLVEALLCAYVVPGSVVLDPFMGSGTVLVESARLGLPVHGYEVNPAAYLLARVYELCESPLPKRLEALNNAEAILTQARPAAFELPLFRTAVTAPLPASASPHWVRATTDPAVKTLLEALLVLLDDNADHDDSYVHNWTSIREVVLNLPHSASPVRASLGDARRLHLPDASVGFVLSLPPYINVFNYHHNSRSGIESLGWKPLVVARSEIGANRKFRQNRFLTVVQYCIDMALVLTELRRVCTDSARIILVLGRESNVHKTAIYNSQILEHLAVKVVGLRVHLKQERVFLNRFGQSIYEDLLHLSPEPTWRPPSKDAIIEHARNVGTQALVEAAGRTPGDRKHFLDEAITRAREVEPSPVLQPAEANGASL